MAHAALHSLLLYLPARGYTLFNRKWKQWSTKTHEWKVIYNSKSLARLKTQTLEPGARQSLAFYSTERRFSVPGMVVSYSVFWSRNKTIKLFYFLCNNNKKRKF